MRRNFLTSLVLIFSACAVVAGDLQSLIQAARKEAERRQKLEQQNIKEKKIDPAADPSNLAPGASVSISSQRTDTVTARAAAAKPPPRRTLLSFQTRLRKLDQDIAQASERLNKLRAQADAERSAPARMVRMPRGLSGSNTQSKLAGQIQDLEAKLKRMRLERDDTFLAGRRAGYLPGELENRGIIR